MRLVRALAILLLSSASLLLLVWLLCRAVGDRFVWSQFGAWTPAWMVLVAAAPPLLLGGLLARLARRRATTPPSERLAASQADTVSPAATASPLPTSHFRLPTFPRVLLLAWVSIALWMFAIDWRLILPRRSAPAGAPTLRILAWNVSKPNFPEIAGAVASVDPDLMLLTNPPLHTSLAGSKDRMRPPVHAMSAGRFAIVARFPVLRWCVLNLGITGSDPRTFRWQGGGMVFKDTGEALLVELDTTQTLGRTTIVWMLDLPSQPSIPRSRMVQQARAALTTTSPTVFERDGAAGRDAPAADQAGALTRLRVPDLIAGDFNTPRDSRSLLDVMGPGGYVHAFHQGGRGLDNTWSRRYPVLAIDHIFLREDAFVCTRYEARDLGGGWHRAQVADVSPLSGGKP